MLEFWKEVEGYPGYLVSNLGRVQSLPRTVTNYRKGDPYERTFKGRMLKLILRNTGYYYVGLSKGTELRQVGVHCLVCEMFHGPAPEGHMAAHNNGDPLDNRSKNLRWATPKENSFDMVKHGKSLKGEKYHQAKLTQAIVDDIRKRSGVGKCSAKSLAAEYNVTKGTVERVISGKTWT